MRGGRPGPAGWRYPRSGVSWSREIGPRMLPDGTDEEEATTRPLTRGLLIRYRVMAFTTAVLLVILVFVGIPLQVVAGRPGVVNVVGTLHGFLYIVYLCVAFSLTRRLRIPKWQMALVLLAGTVPFCAFVAERKMTHRFEAAAGTADPDRGGRRRKSAVSGRTRWLSRRALVLHLEVAIIAPGCAVAAWWQATQALAGNELSWVYSVEWPVFSLLAIAGWWHLLHEDPEAYRLRKQRWNESSEGSPSGAAPQVNGPRVAVEDSVARFSRALAAAIGAELALGLASLFLIPFSRPSGWLPTRGREIYLVHATIGPLLVLGAVLFLWVVRDGPRPVRVAGWIGLAGLVVAGGGGLLTYEQSALRFLGIVLMLAGPGLSLFAYIVPVALRRSGSTEQPDAVIPA